MILDEPTSYLDINISLNFAIITGNEGEKRTDCYYVLT